jgi:hypothetical protein
MSLPSTGMLHFATNGTVAGEIGTSDVHTCRDRPYAVERTKKGNWLTQAGTASASSPF